MGCVGGLFLASWGTRLLLAVNTAKIPRLENVSIDVTVLVFALAVSLLTAVVFGLIPATQFSRLDLQSTLKEGGRGAVAGQTRQWIRSSLVVAEVAVALVLLTGAGLLVRSFVSVLRVDPGFDKDNVLALQVFLGRNFQKAEQITGYFDQTLAKIGNVPGVQSAAVVTSPPFIHL